MEEFFRTHRRLGGIFFLVAGLFLSALLKYSYDRGDSIRTTTFLAPACILYGLAVTLHPPLLLMRGEYRDAPSGVKILNGLIWIVGFGISFYLQFVVFKDWK